MRPRNRFLILWAVACGGCSDASEGAAPDAGESADGGGSAAHDAVAASDAGEVFRLAPFLTDYIAEFDRQMESFCTCAVQAGGFPSVPECLALVGSGPDWVECASTAVAARDGGAPVMTMDNAQCLLEQEAQRADCLEAAACDPIKIGECQDAPSSCEQVSNELIVYLVEQCPDIGGLSRFGDPAP